MTIKILWGFLIVIVLIALIGTGLYFQHRFGNKNIVADINKQCCEECQKFATGSDDQRTCIGSENLSEECRRYFEKNPDKEKKCFKGSFLVSLLEFLGLREKPSDSGLGQWFGQTCSKPYIWWRDLEEIEKRFKDKTWSGTFSADLHDQEGDGYNYSVKISGLHMVFDSDVETLIKSDQSFKKVNIWTPCTDEPFLGFMGLKMEGAGEITYSVFENEEQLGCGGLDETHPTICVVTNNPIIVNVKGKIYFSDEGTRLALHPLKPGVNEEEILAACGEDPDSCDVEEILKKSKISLEGYCDGTCQLSHAKIHCLMNDDTCGEWNVKEIIGEGLVDFVDGRDIRLNEDESTNIATFFHGDSEKKAYLTGTLYLND